ncbi:RNA-binding S4 domain-containing protein [Dysgonomonas sp. 25]|uniref:RNA-binding S4 domain-containing protein n=1 Tax=Dysgonomonas sp. 25 TaxID=2302933 RepID=UPI0013D627DE|nr:RNA-binding S4 domain-containing protein [Dysgonomonas sp. 25]NDV69514.1 RNA-binding S4 domain-containing protein [Dysgonomonas sp. 25]
MSEKKEVRIDKWLWAVRLFKTRTIAIEACKKGRITIKGVTIKPSRMIKVGEVIEIRKPPITYSFEVLDLTERRMGAKLVPGFIKDVTPASELQILEMTKISGFVDRARGTGRPTKKDRRELDEFFDDGFDFDFDFDGED